MRRMLDLIILIFVLLSWGFYLAYGTTICISPRHGYGTDISIARWWDNELTIEMYNGQKYYIKTKWDCTTYKAWLEEGLQIKDSTEDLVPFTKIVCIHGRFDPDYGNPNKGLQVYNNLSSFFASCNIPSRDMRSEYYYREEQYCPPTAYDPPRSCWIFKIKDTYVKSVSIE